MRILQLLSLGRSKEAEQLARDWIVEDPNDPDAFFWLARALINQSKACEAEAVAHAGLALNAMDANLHYILAEALFSRGKYRASHKALQPAIELDPDDSHNLILQGHIHLNLDQRPLALESANRALALAPDSSEALQLRASVLARMNKSEAANADMMQVFSEYADDSSAHLTQGWNCLLGGSYQQASTHFTESLRIDPTNDAARKGLLETFKARSIIYRVLFGFLMWIEKLSPTWQIVLFASFFLLRNKIPIAVAFVTRSIMAAILVDAAITIFILLILSKDAIFNLVISLDRKTRAALNDRELKGVRWASIFLFGMIASIFAGFFSDFYGLQIILALTCAIMASSVIELHELENPRSHREVTIVLASSCIVMAGLAFATVAHVPEAFRILRMLCLGLLLYSMRISSLRREE